MSKTVKKVCQCVNCGNESEMVITCSLPEELEETEVAGEGKKTETKRVKGTAVCSHCGNEAEMWLDI